MCRDTLFTGAVAYPIPPAKEPSVKKFGTFSGVFVPSYEAMLGAVVFLILPGLVGGLGLAKMLVIIVVAHSLTAATAFSIADCTSNLEKIGAGGMYVLASRSLGKAFGGSIGIQLFLAQAVSIGFYSIGFADPLQKIIASVPAVQDIISAYGLSPLVQKQIIATLVAAVAFVFGIVGKDIVVKTQKVIFAVLSVSIAAMLVSPWGGVTYNGEALFSTGINWGGTGMALGFWGAFTAFFPAVTGIDAGIGMSGSLKDPKKALSRGTFLSILVTFMIYIALAWVFGFMRKGVMTGPGGSVLTALELFSETPVIPAILLMGILFTAGSSAVSYFMTAPRTAQALAGDDVLPRALSFLGKDFSSKGGKPRWATLLTFAILIPVIWSGDVVTASMAAGICFLVVYGWVNLAAFFERISGNPSFRPTSTGHWAVSLYGFILCMVVISLFNPFVGILVLGSQLTVFTLLLKYKSNNRLEGIWWGLTFSLVNWAFRRMRMIIQGTKNWRPVVGIFTFADKGGASLKALEMGRRISDYKGLTMINVLKPGKVDEPAFDLPVEAEVVRSKNEDFDQSILSIIQGAAPGGLHINTVFLPLDKRLQLVSLIEEIIALGRNVLLYKPGTRSEPEINPESRIDVWWKGEENGNLMALLSYIIVQSDREQGMVRRDVRIIRKLFAGEDSAAARSEMEALLAGARLSGEVVILPEDKEPIHGTIRSVSSDASLILVGMPGRRAPGIAKLFALDEVFFSKEIDRFDNFPPILFTKAAIVMDLIE